MAIRARLASALGRRDEQPNVALAEDIVRKRDRRAIGELVALLGQGERRTQQDAIKVLYEVGERSPKAIVEHAQVFLRTIGSKNNRLVWGALTALACVARADPERVRPHLDAMLAAADRGSVIAKDRAIDILCSLASARHPATAATLVARLETSAANQLPMYAERILGVPLSKASEQEFRRILRNRLPGLPTTAKRRRVEAVLERLGRGTTR